MSVVLGSRLGCTACPPAHSSKALCRTKQLLVGQQSSLACLLMQKGQLVRYDLNNCAACNTDYVLFINVDLQLVSQTGCQAITSQCFTVCTAGSHIDTACFITMLTSSFTYALQLSLPVGLESPFRCLNEPLDDMHHCNQQSVRFHNHILLWILLTARQWHKHCRQPCERCTETSSQACKLQLQPCSCSCFCSCAVCSPLYTLPVVVHTFL